MRFIAFLSFLWATPSPDPDQASLQLGDTVLIGKHFQSSNVDFFGGIPYAEPPLGDLRLSPPLPKYSLSPLQSFDARSYGHRCLQPVSHLFFPLPPSADSSQYSNLVMSEDCLTLNIYRPSGIDVDASLPVMVWIYGGGFYGTWNVERVSAFPEFNEYRWYFGIL